MRRILLATSTWPLLWTLPAAGKHTANSHHLSALVTPAGKSYECQAQQTISLASSDPQKTVTMILSAVHIQPFDIISDFVFSEGRWVGSPEEGEVDSGWRQNVTCRAPGCYPWVVSRVAWLCLPLQRFLKTTGSRLKKWLFLLFLSPSCPSFPLSFSLCSFSPFSQFRLFFSIVFFLPSFGKRGDWIGRQSVGKKPRIWCKFLKEKAAENSKQLCREPWIGERSLLVWVSVSSRSLDTSSPRFYHCKSKFCVSKMQ